MSYIDGLNGFTNAANTIFSQIQHFDRMKESRANRALQEKELSERTRLADANLSLAQKQQELATTAQNDLVSHRKTLANLQQQQLDMAKDKEQYTREQTIFGGWVADYEAASARYGNDLKQMMQDPQFLQTMDTVLGKSKAGAAGFKDAFNLPKGTNAVMKRVGDEVIAMVASPDGKTWTPYKGEDGKVKALKLDQAVFALNAVGSTFGQSNLTEAAMAVKGGPARQQPGGTDPTEAIPYLQNHDSANEKLYDFTFNADTSVGEGSPAPQNPLADEGEGTGFNGISVDRMNPDLARGFPDEKVRANVAQSHKAEYDNLLAERDREIGHIERLKGIQPRGLGGHVSVELARSIKDAEKRLVEIDARTKQLESSYTGATPKGQAPTPKGTVNAEKTQQYMDELAAQFPQFAEVANANPEIAQLAAETQNKRVTPRHEKTLLDDNADAEKRAYAYTLVSLRAGREPDMDTLARIKRGDESTAADRELLKKQYDIAVQREKEFAAAAKGSREAAAKLIETTKEAIAADLAGDKDIIKRLNLNPDLTGKELVSAILGKVTAMLNSNTTSLNSFGIDQTKPETATPGSLGALHQAVTKAFRSSRLGSSDFFGNDNSVDNTLVLNPPANATGSKYETMRRSLEAIYKGAENGDPAFRRMYSLISGKPEAEQLKLLYEERYGKDEGDNK